MIRKCLGTVGLLVSLHSAAVTLAAGPNLLTNPAFDSGTSGWQVGTSVIAIVARADVGSTLPGGSGPPCVEVRSSHPANSFGGAIQRVTLTAGHQYLLAASAYVPSTENPANQLGALVFFYDESSPTAISFTSLYASPTPYDRWQHFEGSVVAPAGAVSAWVVLAVRNPNVPTPPPPAVAFFDDAFFGEMTAPAQEVDELFLPVASSKSGLNGTFWITDAWLTNLATTPTVVKAAVLVPGQDNSVAVANAGILDTFEAAESASWTDLVSRLGTNGVTGAVYLRAETPATESDRDLIAVTSRNSTRNPAGAGRYGQAVMAVGAGDREQVAATGALVSNDYRTNVGVLNTSPETISVAIEVRDKSYGWTVAATTWSLQPYEPRMVNATSLGIASLDGNPVLFSLTSATGSFRGFLSVVDNGTNDSIYIPAN